MAMTIVSLTRELWRALNFVSSIQFWRMGLLWTFSILYSRFLLFKASLFNQKLKSHPRCTPSIFPKRPICVITGATSGLGLAVAHALSKEGYVVVIVGRSQQLLLEAEEKIKVWNRDAQLKGFQVDLSSIESIVKFRKSLQQWLKVDERSVSGKRFLSSKQYPYAYIYEYSKLCLLLFTFELKQQLRVMNKSNQIFVNAADPGVVHTNIMREVPSIVSWVACFVLKRLGLLQSPECGMNSIIDAALAPATPETSGAYFFGGEGRTIEPSAVSKNSELALKLWETTCNLLAETPFGVEDNSTDRF